MQWLKQLVGLNGEERQTLTTVSMMAGAMALTVAIGLLVYVLRYSWPEAVVAQNATIIMGYLFKIIVGFMILCGLQIFAQAAIAVGGKLSAAWGDAKIEAESERDTH